MVNIYTDINMFHRLITPKSASSVQVESEKHSPTETVEIRAKKHSILINKHTMECLHINKLYNSFLKY